MKRVAAAALIFSIACLFSIFPQWSLSDSGSSDTAPSGTTIAVSGIDVSANDLIVAAINFETGAADRVVSSVTDGGSNSLTILTQQESANTMAVIAYKLAGSAATEATFTATLSDTAEYRQMTIYVFSGGDGSQTLEDDGGATGTGTSLDTGSITTVEQNIVAVASMHNYSGVGSNYQIDAGAATGSTDAASGYGATWYKLFTNTPGAMSATATVPNDEWAGVIAAFEDGGGGGEPPATVVPQLMQYYQQQQ